MVMDHGRLVAAVNRVGLRARGQTDLDAASGWKILARDDVEDELHVLVPMDALFLGARRLRHVKPEVYDGAVRAPLAGKHPPEFDMVALHEENRVGKQRID